MTKSIKQLADRIIDLTSLVFIEAEIERLEEMKKEYPPNLKQEIWGGEGGLPNTKIESPDVFGIKYVDGYNQALQDQISHLKELLVTLKR